MKDLPAFFQPIFLDSVSSTNDEVKRRALAGASEGTLVVAGEQLAGRGRSGRKWKSKPGNLYASLLLRPKCDVASASQISFLAAVALTTAVVKIAPYLTPVHKWPNDVLINGAKLSGILLESAARSSNLIDWLILGIGVNVVHHPEEASMAATSLREHGVAKIDAKSMLHALAPALLHWLGVWQAQGFRPVRTAWLKRATGLNCPINVRLPREEFSGIFRDLGDDGSLLVEQDDGTIRAITAGEVFLPQM